MIFTVLGAVAELERSLIAERVRAGLRNARAKGKRLGRPTKHGKPRPNSRPARPGGAVAAHWGTARG
jgi:DNA invertase Pin-like site-specific DNA recombinase